jgi:hypothetical protein
VRADEASPKEADQPGEEDSGTAGVAKGSNMYLGAKGVEYPKRFFARDYAGNRLEFSL